MKTQSVVTLSGGLDSSVNLYWAHEQTQVVKVLHFDYGQRAAAREWESANYLAGQLGLSIERIEIPWLKKITQTSLVSRSSQVPTGVQVAIDDLNTSKLTAQAVWVPNRNGVFINIAAAYAESLRAKQIVVGFNAEEAATFPDNSSDFIKAANSALSFSTANHVEVVCYTTFMHKTDIAALAKKMNVPTDRLWPCYLDGVRPCGQCESCLRFKRALET